MKRIRLNSFVILSGAAALLSAMLYLSFSKGKIAPSKDKSSAESGGRAGQIKKQGDPSPSLTPPVTVPNPKRQDAIETELMLAKARSYHDEKNRKLEVVKDIQERKDATEIPKLLDWMFELGIGSNPSDIVESYPCVKALIKIGEPAVEPLEQRILLAENKAEELTQLYTLVKIKGAHYVANWIKVAQKPGRFPLTNAHQAEILNWLKGFDQ